MEITASSKTTFPLILSMREKEQSLAEIFNAFGIQPASFLAVELEVPVATSIAVVDDLAAAGFGKVELKFIVQQAAKLSYRLREIAGLSSSADESVQAVLERSITVVLAGKGADADVKCLYFGDAKRVFKVKTAQEHRAEEATSNVVVKSVLTQEARLTCHSMINVAPGANGTHAEQVNKNILLSRAARAVSVPMLEVLANDVKCKHGAAVSRIDDEQLFYLQSRGIAPDQTKTILLEAFLN